MKFSYLSFNELLPVINNDNLKVSFLIHANKSLNFNMQYHCVSVLHHKDFYFPQSYLRQAQIHLEGPNQSHLRDFIDKIHEVKEDSIIILKDHPNNYLLAEMLQKKGIMFSSVIHDNILSHDFIADLQSNWSNHILANNLNLSHTLPTTLEYPAKQCYLNNMIELNDEDLELSVLATYKQTLLDTFSYLNDRGISPLDISFLSSDYYPILLDKSIQWLENNNSNENIQNVLKFFKNNGSTSFFEQHLKSPGNRHVLESFISSIDSNSDEEFKAIIYKDYPFLKFDIPNLFSKVTDNELHINLTTILSLNNYPSLDHSFNLPVKNKVMTHKDNVLHNLQRMINHSTKFYGLKPFKVQKISGNIFKLEGDNSLQTNQKVADFLNILFYEIFNVANPIENNLEKTLAANISHIHNQVLNNEIPEASTNKPNNVHKF